MTNFLPSPQSCCRPCCRDSVLIINNTSHREVYSGNGDPNGQLTPDDPSKDAIYNNLDTPGETWWWAGGGNTWV